MDIEVIAPEIREADRVKFEARDPLFFERQRRDLHKGAHAAGVDHFLKENGKVFRFRGRFRERREFLTVVNAERAD